MKAILLLLLVPLMAIPAYAEQVTIDVPFKVAEQEGQEPCTLFFDPTNSRIQIMRCWFVSEIMAEDYQPTELIPYATADPAPVCADGLQWDDVTGQCEEIIISQETPDLTTEQEQLLYISNTLDYLKNKANPTVTEQWFIEEFSDNIRHCSYGILAAQAFQKQSDFVISPDWVQWIDGIPVYIFPEMATDKAINLRGSGPAVDLYFQNEACRAQGNYYDGDISPQHYIHFIMTPLPEDEICKKQYDVLREDSYDCQPYHGEQATVQSAWTDRQDGDLAEESQKAWNDSICNNDNFDTKTKAQFNCPKPVYEGFLFGDRSDPIKQGPRNPVEAKVIWQNLSCGIPSSPIVNDIHLGYLEEMATNYACNAWPRVTAIDVFTSGNNETIQAWIADYEFKKESQK